MDFSIDAAAVQKAIKALGMVAKANVADASGRVLIEATDNGVLFTSNNGYTAISFSVPDAVIRVPGTTAIIYSKIKSFVASFKPWDGESGVKTFDFVLSDRNIKVTVNNVYSNGKFSKGELVLTSSNPNLITKLPEFGEISFTLNSTIFKAAMNKVLYAINPQGDYNQPALEGMYIRFENDDIFFAGANSVVLSEYQVKNVTGRFEGEVIIQYDFIMGLKRLLSGDDVVLFWGINGNRVSVKFDEIVYTGRRIIGHDFPEYKPMLENYTDHINLSKDFLMGVLSPFSDILDPEDNFRLTIEIKDKLFRIFSSQAKIEADQDIVGGLDFSIDLNGKQLIQTIDAIKDDYILFKFSDSGKSAIFDSSTFNDQKSLISSIRKR